MRKDTSSALLFLTLLLSHLDPFKPPQAGCTHSLAVTRDGLVYSWGSSDHGKLGHGPAPDMNEESALMTTHTSKWWPFCPTPMEVNGLRGRPIAKVACGEFHSLAATIDGEVLAWGLSSEGLLGIEPGEEHKGALATTCDGKHLQADLPVAVDNLPWGCVEHMCCANPCVAARADLVRSSRGFLQQPSGRVLTVRHVVAGMSKSPRRVHIPSCCTRTSTPWTR